MPRRKITTSIEEWQYMALRQEAFKKQIKMSDLIRDALKKYFNELLPLSK